MGTFFVRRLVGGLAELLLISFLLYSLLALQLVFTVENIRSTDSFGPSVGDKRLEVMYALDKPWPANYLAWLIDPMGAKGHAFNFPGHQTMLGFVAPQTVTFVHSGSGVLTGDFGESVQVDVGTPVLTVFGLDGPGLPLLLAIPFSTLLFFMLVVALQRRGRPPVYGFRAADNPVRKVWRRAELWPLG